MKRSEIFKILEERFEQIGLNITPCILAESILRIIEDAGMLPPSKPENEITFTTLDGTKIGSSFDGYVWDEE